MPSSLTEHDQQILDAARVEFETYGLRRANVDSVAKRAGVGGVEVQEESGCEGFEFGGIFARDDVGPGVDAGFEGV